MPSPARPRLAHPSPDDPVAAAIHHHATSVGELAAAAQAIAAAIQAATAQREPMDGFFAGLSDRLELLCRWLRRKGPWLLASIPPALVAIQAVSPQAAKALGLLLNGAMQ